jgi:hypothetical protein
MGKHLWTRQRLRLVTCVANRPSLLDVVLLLLHLSRPLVPQSLLPLVSNRRYLVSNRRCPRARYRAVRAWLITGHRRLHPPPNDQSSTMITLRTSPLSSEIIDDSSSRESSSPTIGPVRLLVTTLDTLTHPLGKVSSIL